MADPRIADDFDSISARLRELEQAKAPVRWAIWHPGTARWAAQTGSKLTLATSEPTLFESPEAAAKAVAACLTGVALHTIVEIRVYEPS